MAVTCKSKASASSQLGVILRQIQAYAQSWPVTGSFRIARSSLTAIEVVKVTICDAGHTGVGECRPYARYNETPQSVLAQIEDARPAIETGISTDALQSLMPAGAARNAVDCALWDLAAKQQGKPAAQLLGLPAPTPLRTAFTLSVDTPANMAKAALAASDYALLKMKIKDLSGLEAAHAVLRVRPDAELIIDANEALVPRDLPAFQSALADLPVLMIEQPVAASAAGSAPIAPARLPIICADESLHGRDDLKALWDLGYRAVNIKLDKCGGLTEGLQLMEAAKDMGFIIMAGCMVGTSLAMAPMLHLAGMADVVDLDGPALLASDCRYGLVYENGKVGAPDPRLWGGAA